MNRRPIATSLVLTLTLITVVILSPASGMLISPSHPASMGVSVANGDNPYPIYSLGTLDEIRVVEYATLTDALEAIDQGNADLLGHRLEAADYSILGGYPNIIPQWAHDTRQCWLSLNAKSYPIDSVHLRRAIGYAINKTEIAELAFGGLVDPVDLPILLGDALSREGVEGGKFYDPDLDRAQSALGAGGMLDVDDDGFVEAPNGSDFSLSLMYPFDVEGMNLTAQTIHANLLAVGINCTVEQESGIVIKTGLDSHTLDYDMAVTSVNLSIYEPFWGITTFDSDRVNENGENMAQISDGVIDNTIFQYADTFSLEDRQDAVVEGMRAIRDRCPVVPLFNYRWLSVYSAANFENWPDDRNGGAFSLWTPVTITAKPDSDNILRVAVLPTYFADFFKTVNVLDSGDTLDHQWAITNQFNPYLLVYDTPVALSPDRRYVPRASTSWDVLYRGTIADIESSQTRVRLYCDPNANCTDGVELNSEDYRFTYSVLANQSKMVNADLVAGFKTTGQYIAGITMDGLNPFTYRAYAELPVLPRHIWEPQNLSIWNPTLEDAVGSGPYTITEFTPGTSLTLTINRGYYPVVDEEPPALNRINQYPTNAIPAESVVIRVFIDDRSPIENVTLQWTHHVGDLNFSSSTQMSETVIGYLGTIPSRITATSTSYSIVATDIWGNTALIATGYYERSTETAENGGLLTVLAISGIVAAVAIVFVLSRRRR